MISKKVEALIIKYFSKSATIEERAELKDWLKEEANSNVFKEFVKTNYLINFSMPDFDKDLGKRNVLNRIEELKQKKRRIIQWNAMKYAAIFIIVFGLGFILIVDNKPPKIEENPRGVANTESKILPGSSKAILTLDNGVEVMLDKDKPAKLKGIAHNGEQLVYKSDPARGDDLQYNLLTIPRGGQFFLRLSDGTKVWLNSDSKLKYPVNFIKGQPRIVELEYGEAYFDVSKSTEHDGASFLVKSGMQEIQVLGTAFNLKAYNNENEIVTTLVEGSLSVSNGAEKVIIKPSEQAIVREKNTNIDIKEVTDIFNEIAWKEGYFSFKSMSMKDIMITLSRWYDADYSFKDAKKENIIFTGVLNRQNSIEQILNHIQKTNEINYKIYEKTIVIE